MQTRFFFVRRCFYSVRVYFFFFIFLLPLLNHFYLEFIMNISTTILVKTTASSCDFVGLTIHIISFWYIPSSLWAVSMKILRTLSCHVLAQMSYVWLCASVSVRCGVVRVYWTKCTINFQSYVCKYFRRKCISLFFRKRYFSAENHIAFDALLWFPVHVACVSCAPKYLNYDLKKMKPKVVNSIETDRSFSWHTNLST